MSPDFKIEGIIFDLGKVLIEYSFQRAFEKWAELTKNTNYLFEARFVYEDPTLHQYERGQITSNQYFQYLSHIMEIQWTFDQFKEGWVYTNIGVNQELIPLLEKLQKDYRLFILSNTNELHANNIMERFPYLFSYFETPFFSHQMNARKPEVLIYQKLLESIQILPEKLVFIDDLEKNLTTAEELGIKTIKMSSKTQLLEDLKSFGVI